MNKVLIAIAAIVVLAVGGLVIYDKGRSDTGSTEGNNNTNGSPPPSNQTAPSAGAISITNMMFTPSQISVQKGSTVTWTNDDNVTHTVIDDLSNVGGPASGNIEPGSAYSFTFNKTGSFQYHCKLHPSMRGTIVVQ
jgi:plastocyanin